MTEQKHQRRSKPAQTPQNPQKKTPPPQTNKEEIILRTAWFIEFGIVSLQFAAGAGRLKCSAMHLAKQLAGAGETLPLEFVKGPETLPGTSGRHVGEERADLSSGVLPPGPSPYAFLGGSADKIINE